MSLIVSRTVTVVGEKPGRSAPLTDFRSRKAYVLLGDPGAGKTKAFETECEDHADSEFATARRFIRKSLDRMSDWEKKTLFIDGLDEVRAGTSDPRRQLDQILERLRRLDNPDFRLSCRTADWLGRNGLREGVEGAGYEDVCVLYLEPLTPADIRGILIDLGEPDVAGFLAKAREHGLEGLLDNPQLLGLLVEATRDGKWPRGLRKTFELACRSLTRSGCREEPEVNGTMAAAGHLSALLLLSDMEFLATNPSNHPDTLCLADIDGGDTTARSRALRSNLFVSCPGGHFVSNHPHEAAFLAARFLHRCIKDDVPVGRILSLISGEDGVVVTRLRSLSAWLAAFNRSARTSLINADPVGIALYGDVGGFRKREIRRLLRAFADKADEIQPWDWPPLALASLINDHSVALLARHLNDDDRSEARQTVVGLLLHALSRVDRGTPGSISLERTIRDATWSNWVRHCALRALLHHSGDEGPCPLIRLLDDLRDGRVEDRDGDLLGALLDRLYPVHLDPDRIWDYLVPRGSPDHVGTYRIFWSAHLPNRTRVSELVALLRSLREQGEALREHLQDDWLCRLIRKLVRRALGHAGDHVSVSTLYDWLELIDVEGIESTMARTREYLEVSGWLADRPELQKELALEGLHRRVGIDDAASCAAREGDGDRKSHGHTNADDAHYHAFQIRWAIFRAGAPDDFAQWCLHQAVAIADTDTMIARILLDWSRPWGQDDSGPEPSIEEVRHATRGSSALRDEVARLLEGEKKSEAREAEMGFRKEEDEYRRERRREQEGFITHVREQATELQKGRCPPGLLHRIAVAYHDFFHDQREATPRQRVLKLLQGHHDLAGAAIEGFRRVGDRDDLPTLRKSSGLTSRS